MKICTKQSLVKQEPVNLTHQTIFAIIPYANLYACYRVQKLTKFIFISIAVLLIGVTLFVGITIGMMIQDGPTVESFSIYQNNMKLWENPLLPIVDYTGSVLFSIYLVRRWSNQWNKQFEELNS